jgi:hypothetical protein
MGILKARYVPRAFVSEPGTYRAPMDLSGSGHGELWHDQNGKGSHRLAHGGLYALLNLGAEFI